MQSSLNNYESQGKSRACIDRDQSTCEPDGEVCVGENGANFVYELTGKPDFRNSIVLGCYFNSYGSWKIPRLYYV